jgi:8-oxo-dGTP diphosphatase
MAHIHTKPGQHDFTASAFIIRIDTPKPKVLLHMHKKLGVLLQPGGHIELNENPWQAVHHEIEEETGTTSANLSCYNQK